MDNRREYDIDSNLHTERIKCVIYNEDEHKFYLVCNEMHHEMGFFLIQFEENNPANHTVLTALVTLLEIDNVNMFISTGVSKTGDLFKELIIGYKTMNINTYNTIIQDLMDGTILFKHEAF